MSSYLTSILTTTTSRYTSLKKSLLPNENDGDTEDDTHISRVLRAYYAEKGRPFPPWLPPDPKAPQPPPTQPAYLNVQPGAGGRAPAGSVLSDIWDPQPQPGPGRGEEDQFSNSLRRGRRGGAAGMQSHAGVTASAPPGRLGGSGGGGFADSYQPGGGSNATARPLPSQRAGSYQSQFSQQGDPPSRSGSGSSAAGGASAQERLKARLWGGAGAGRSASPPTGATAGGAGPGGRQGPYAPPPSAGSASSQGSAYDRGGGASNNPYTTPRGGTQGAPGGVAGYGRSGDSGRAPYVGASSPWSTGEDDYISGGRGGGGGGGGGIGGGGGGGGNLYEGQRGGGREQQGSGGRDLGSGGRFGGRPVGLPSGPRMR